MNEILKSELLEKLISNKDIEKELKLRKRTFVTKNVQNLNITEYNKLINEGWKLQQILKNHKKLKKDKSHDVKFEDKVWSLFAQMGFLVLNKDRKFNIPYDNSNPKLTQQIDIIAKDDETILLIECKSATKKNKNGNFKKELETYKSEIGGIWKTVKQLFPDNKFKYKFVFATENYKINSNDSYRLKELNGYHLGDEELYYYINLQKQIGLASRYQLLGSLFSGQEIPELDNEIPAIKGKMGGYTYYSFSIEPEKLLKLGYVLHRNKANINSMSTYQRIIKKTRLNSIHDFIDNQNGYFPNSIIISIDSRKKGNLEFDKANTQVKSAIASVGILHLPKRYCSAYIIDGQHRLYGYANSIYKFKNSIPVVAFVDLEPEEQVKLFMQINENQKAVPKNLRTTLNADLLWNSNNYIEQQKALCCRVSIALGENKSSPLFGLVSIGEDKRNISLEAFEKSLSKNIFLGKVTKKEIQESGVFFKGDLELSYNRLLQFLILTFKFIRNCIPEVWENNNYNNILLMNKGIYSFIKLQGDIINYLLSKSIISKEDTPLYIFNQTRKYLEPAINFISQIDDETANTLIKSYGEGGYSKYWRKLQISVFKVYPDFSPNSLSDYIKNAKYI